MKSPKDHAERRNYDDINEFFWSRSCLNYHYSNADPAELGDLEGGSKSSMPLESLPSISEGLATAPKPF